MLAFRVSPRVGRSLIAACLLGGCGRWGFEEQLQTSNAADRSGRPSFSTGDSAGELSTGDGASELKPGEAPNEPVPSLPNGDASSPSTDAGQAVLDAGTTPADAGTTTNSGIDAGTADAAPRNCAGVLFENICWYLSGSGETCNDVCRNHNGVDRNSPNIIGSQRQGGSAENCAQIFKLLGFRDNSVATGFRSDGAGLGCHRWDDGVLWWLTQPDFDQASSSSSASRVCGCTD